MNLEPRTFTLQVPSSTANLGPGFDCLGLALDLYNVWRVEVTELGVPGSLKVVESKGESAATLPTDDRHLFFQSWKKLSQDRFGPDLRAALKAAGLSVRLSADNATPLARGLGSSAALRVASAEAYRLLTGCLELESWQLASTLEGHPDNAAPAGLGGLIGGLRTHQKQWKALSLEIHDCWKVVVAIPEFSLLTSESRRVLPKKYGKAAAVFNLSRMPYLLEGLRRGDSDLVAWGCDDQLHQPHRADLIPGFNEVTKAGVQAGGSAVYLSGAGPTMAAFVDQRIGKTEAVAAEMTRAFHEIGVVARARVMNVDRAGLRVLEGQTTT